MKPPAFDYHRPETRAEVDDLLAEHGDDAKVLAGGQSLVPILNFRLASPGHVVDINRLSAETDEPVRANGVVSFGCLVRQSSAERSGVVAECLPLLAEAIRFVAHPAIRSRGTIAGSVAHADPAAELPAVLVVLEAEVCARGTGGRRTIAARDFFTGPLENALAPGEWIEEIRIPLQRGDGAFEEFARRRGDYALCGVAALVDGDGGSRRARLAYLGMGDVPRALELPLPGDDGVEEALRALVEAELEPSDDIHAGASYRRFLAVKLGARAVRRAAAAGPR
ncbi:MAG TPA: xanthine dehydrogenase family protein subunit M [Actinomycetota bacterium]|nr:xanthine dehydrogenase family protein subunit M [Actinomycetota bacterium]